MGRTEYGSEFDWDSAAGFLKNTASPPTGVHLYRSGRDALKALARSADAKEKTVLLPALCCESMAVPFELNGWDVVFYKLNPNLTADTADVETKLKDGMTLLYMRYFGIVPFEDAFLDSLRKKLPNVIFVEDRTQDIIIPRAHGGFEPDAMIASLRKWTALPEGGVLKTALRVEQGSPAPAFGQIRHAVMEEKSLYLRTFDKELKAAFMARLHGADALLDASCEPAAMSEEYFEHLCRVDFEKIRERRTQNIMCLKECLKPLENAGKLHFLTDKPENSTLYFPVLLEERDRVWHRMIEEKIYCAVIWPIPEKAKGICAATEYNNRHMLGIICDQRCGAEDIDFIADTLEKALG